MKSECDDMSDQELKQCIQAIDRTSVHRICSGQVILNLASAIKELVENSLDAGATNIEVRLKDYGSELIEVVDNGEGVEEDNFIGLTLKHHTSKLKDFSDLVNTETFGFRGEALSSLCALSKMSIVTCHHHATVGTRLEYDSHGNIIKRLPYPRQRGTSVTLQNLFYTLPVRHKEFLRNLKREFSKAIHILNAYCIISTGVRISCTNQIGKGKKTTVVSTGGNTTLIENITNIFGAKQAQNLLSFTQTSPSEEICTEFNIKEEQLKKAFFQISGYVSSSENGLGRSAADRQFYYINKRPCDPLKISRLVNEVYHMYNRHQYPFVVLDVSLAKDSVDVNVTPDKRQIFLQQEKLLLALLKSSLIKMFEPRSSLYKINDASSKKKQGCLGSWSFNRSLSESKSPSPHLDNSKCTGSLSSSLKRKFSSIYVKHSEASPSEVTAKSMKADLYVTSVTKSNTLSISSNINTNKNMSYHEFQGDNNESSVQSGLLQKTMYTDDIISISEDDNTQNSSGDHFISRDMKTKKLDHSCGPSEFEKSSALALPEMLDVKLDCFNKKHVTEAEIITSSDDLTSSPLPKEDGLGFTEKCGTLEIVENSEVSTAVLPEASQHCTSEAEQHAAQMPDPPDPGDFTEDINPDGSITVTSSEYDKPASVVRKEIKIEFSMDRLRRTLTTQRAKCEEEKKYCRFRASIKLTDNHIAEDELKKEISKDMFSRMDILGQFNLGFIITRLDRDIFIIDQHASDEKYNFEELQKHTVIHGQKLIKPQILELTPANESILIENREIFHKNGFDLAIDENALPTQRVSLITMPVKGNWAFGREDIDELIFILSDSPGVMCRPSRIRQMFASKACRKSVMIGTALNKTEMKKIVCRMGELDQPWNCPHGRPTMRHLISLNILPD